jgi:glycerol-3-phosphate dehydrogenase subunit C
LNIILTFSFPSTALIILGKSTKRMAEAVKEAAADYTVTECGMCKNQLDQLTEKAVKHPMQILAESYERAKALI